MFAALLRYRMPAPALLRKCALAHRFTPPEMLKEGLVDEIVDGEVVTKRAIEIGQVEGGKVGGGSLGGMKVRGYSVTWLDLSLMSCRGPSSAVRAVLQHPRSRKTTKWTIGAMAGRGILHQTNVCEWKYREGQVVRWERL